MNLIPLIITRRTLFLLSNLLLLMPAVGLGQDVLSSTVNFSIVNTNGIEVPGSIRVKVKVLDGKMALPNHLYLASTSPSFSVEIDQLTTIDRASKLKLDWPNDFPDQVEMGRKKGNLTLKQPRDTSKKSTDKLILSFIVKDSGRFSLKIPVDAELPDGKKVAPNISSANRNGLSREASGFLDLQLHILLARKEWARIEAIPAQPYRAKFLAYSRYIKFFKGLPNEENAKDSLKNSIKVEFEAAGNDPEKLKALDETLSLIGYDASYIKRRIDNLKWNKAISQADCNGYKKYLAFQKTYLGNQGKYIEAANLKLREIDKQKWNASLQELGTKKTCRGQTELIQQYIIYMKTTCGQPEPLYEQNALNTIQQIENSPVCNTSKPIKKSLLQQDLETLQVNPSCEALQLFLTTYREDPKLETYQAELDEIKRAYCPLVSGSIRRLATPPLSFHVDVQNFTGGLKIDSVFPQLELGLTVLHMDSTGISLQLPEPIDYKVWLRDGRDSMVRVLIPGSLKPIDVSKVAWSEEEQELTFQLVGGKSPYYFRLKQVGSSSFENGIYELKNVQKSFDAQLRDSIFQFTVKLNEIPFALDGQYEVYVTDYASDEKMVISDLMLDNKRGISLWMVFLGPFILLLGFLIYRNRNTT